LTGGVNADAPVTSASNPLAAEVEVLRLQLAERDRRIAELEAQLAVALARIADLEAKLGLNSSNSSKPPSSDPPWNKPKPKRRSPSGKKPGGQPGHKGAHRELLPPEKVNHTVKHRPSGCKHCGKAFTGEEEAVGEPTRHQVTELPPIVVEVTEHQGVTVLCDGCGQTTEGHIPEDVLQSAFGPRLQAAVATLSQHRMSRREVTQVTADLLGTSMSVGSVQECCERVSEGLAEPVAEAEKAVRNVEIAHADETGWKWLGKKVWLWVVATAVATVFHISQGRRGNIIAGMLGPLFSGTLVVDRCAAYNRLERAVRQLCWAHIKRDFQALVDFGGAAKPIGEWALREIKLLFDLWHAYQAKTLAQDDFLASLRLLKARFKRMLKRGAEQLEVKKGRGLCRNLLKYWDNLWVFTKVPGVDPTNNLSERMLRRAVLWRKGSQGSRSQEGAVFVQRILTAAATCRQQGRSLLNYLTEVCRASMQGRPAPPLLLPPEVPSAPELMTSPATRAEA
jgi:transposase